MSPTVDERTNLALLQRVAEQLGDLRREVVFVGGAAVSLLVTDPGAAPVRATIDVDVVVEAISRLAWNRIERKLRAAGFVPDEEPGAPLCRWRVGVIPVDVMPTDPAILGFANRWYSAVLEKATTVDLSGLSIRLVTAPLFVATKLEAFRQRGRGDLFGSRDLEDIVALIDGRARLVDEVREASADLRAYLSDACRKLLAEPGARDALAGHLPPDAASQGRLPGVLHRIEAIARIK